MSNTFGFFIVFSPYFLYSTIKGRKLRLNIKNGIRIDLTPE